MVWPHDVTRVLNETVTPAKLYQLLVSPEGHLLLQSNVHKKNHGLRLASLRLLQIVETSGLPGMATHLEAKQPLSRFGVQSIGLTP